jgi:hypothetical protein
MKCGIEQPIAEFIPHHNYCRSCEKEEKYPIRIDLMQIYDGKPSKLVYEYEKRYVRLHKYIPTNDKLLYLYVFYSYAHKYYKIGLTSCVYRRHRQLRQHGKAELKTILISVLSDNYHYLSGAWIESFINEYFYSKKVANKNGEWFDLSRNDVMELYRLFYYIDGDYIYDEENPIYFKGRNGTFKFL